MFHRAQHVVKGSVDKDCVVESLKINAFYGAERFTDDSSMIFRLASNTNMEVIHLGLIGVRSFSEADRLSAGEKGC